MRRPATPLQAALLGGLLALIGAVLWATQIDCAAHPTYCTD